MNDKLVQYMLNIDFGDITGEGDPKLFDYFLNDNYWDRIVNGKVFYVIGRKGTGKSAVYRFMEEEATQNGAIVTNADCAAFPFEKLLQLSDDDYSKPNQFQSIWKNIVLNYFIAQIATSWPEEYDNQYYRTICEYYKQFHGGGDISNLHRDIIQKTNKTSVGLQYKSFTVNNENAESSTFSRGFDNITKLNERLLSLLTNYFITTKRQTKFLIQFDRLDDNYNLYQKKTEYYHVILCLCKVIYFINQLFREKRINNAKIIVYLRSDIFTKINQIDAESARFSDFIFELKWAIINRNDWINPRLLQMINKRIEASNVAGIKSFEDLFPDAKINLRNNKGQQKVFNYIIDRSFHRPRDLVKFCICIQEEVCNNKLLYFRTIKDAEKKYSHWFLYAELANEINPILNDKVDATYQLLREMGPHSFRIEDFKTQYNSNRVSILSNYEELLKYLYQVGIVYNFGKDNSGQPIIRSIIRNDNEWNPKMMFQIHTPVWIALSI